MAMLRTTAFTLLLCASTALAASEAGQDAASHSGDAVRLMEDMPSRGSTKQAVRDQLGSPERAVGPVGEPPITRWVYDDFTVYFEHNRVLHSVANRDD